MRKKLVSVILTTIVLGATLTGCCMSHEWQEATCTALRTCTKCGATEGEMREHTWTEATCAAPRTCSVCGLTEGEALEHTWVEANYQQPKTCSVCGATEGETLTPYFVEYDVKGQFMEVGKEYDYITMCIYSDAKTHGKMTVTDYQTFVSDDTHEAKEGYEWKIVDFKCVFSDDNAYKYACTTWKLWSDYYGREIIEDSDDEDDGDDSFEFIVNWNGQKYAECRQIAEQEMGAWIDHVATNHFHYELLLPIGYDGYILGFTDAADYPMAEKGLQEYANEDTLFFRLQ